MKRRNVIYPVTFLLALVGVCFGADQSPTDKFLGNPLLVLTIILAIDVIAFIYHQTRK